MGAGFSLPLLASRLEEGKAQASNCRWPLEAGVGPQGVPSRKSGSRSHNRKELNSVNNPDDYQILPISEQSSKIQNNQTNSPRVAFFDSSIRQSSV